MTLAQQAADRNEERSDLQEARATWDAIDIDQVRDVAWSAIPYFMPRNFAVMARSAGRPGCPDPRRLLRELLRERVPEAERRGLVGGALLCGDMKGEAPIFEPGADLAFERVSGFDLSAASLDRFVPSSFAFDPHVVDCNALELEPDRYDLLVGHHGIHHVMQLDRLFEQARNGLRARGLMMIDEWIGPAFLQIPAPNAFFARLLLYALYPKRRSRTTHMGQLKGAWMQAPPDAFDPSEACNAEALLPAYHRNFEPLAEVRYGGLTYPVFEGLGHTIDMNRWTNQLRVRIVYWAERTLTALGLVKPLFVSSIGAPRPLRHGDAL